jgi:hypothetical protein
VFRKKKGRQFLPPRKQNPKLDVAPHGTTKQGLISRKTGVGEKPRGGKEPVVAIRLADGRKRTGERRKGFNVTVNAYDPVVHVYTGWDGFVNSRPMG